MAEEMPMASVASDLHDHDGFSLESAEDRRLACGLQEEFGPLPSDRPEEKRECITNEQQQQGEEEEEETPQDSQNNVVGGAAEELLPSDCPEGNLWPPSREEHKQHLEVIVNVVASTYSLESDGQLAPFPPPPRPGSPQGDCLEQESCYISDTEDLLQDSGASMGYYPCYLTYAQLPAFQPEDSDDDPPKQPGKVDPTTQVGAPFQKKASNSGGGDKATASMEETKRPPRPEKGSLLPSLEEASGPAKEGQAVAEGDRAAPAPGFPSAPSRSRRGILGWVRHVFRRSSPPPRPEPSPVPGGERGRGNIRTRLRRWILKHRGHVHPHSC